MIPISCCDEASPVKSVTCCKASREAQALEVPVYRALAMNRQGGIGLGEMAATEEAAMGRQRRGVGRCQYGMTRGDQYALGNGG